MEKEKRAESEAPGGKKRVLFVCIGNSCRSQMAEALARAYGADVLIAQSAGLAPAPLIAPLTRSTLAERNIEMGDQFPKGIRDVGREPFDILVNISGYPLPAQAPAAKRVIEWSIPDPIGQSPEVYRSSAQQVESAVMRLILELRGKVA